MIRLTRREFFRKTGLFLVSLFAFYSKYNKVSKAFAEFTSAETIPTRVLGKTGVRVTSFGLGGEGILRTYGRMKEAVAVIHKALDLGVTYFDTAPAYDQSHDYLGVALRGRRDKIFLASKTHDRTRDGSFHLLEDSLKRLRTNHLDLWQFHDLRTKGDLDEIFSKKGALKAAQEAKTQGLIRFIGITGHHDPGILLEAMRRFSFDTVMCSVNAGDVHYLPFKDTVIPEAARQNMGIIGMKVLAGGYILRQDGIKTAKEAIWYVLNFPVSVVIIGCRSPQEVEENVRIAKTFRHLTEEEMRHLESLIKSYFQDANYFKLH
jgi:aryl-alcohol dehydrogenase-like predicted oxidoreductase